ncbi:hypothetical protein [Acidipila rosea]|uniref:Uncharacterized protein n=1 Tax=Acidipila rosea TaxID=768535 RepID=A0A4R1L771_9BACT|nr:hypothetical protein [Acidipila rosea]TCK74062.1 hypothetical protein C7378_1682 [Acidipila rosea]
MPNSTTTANSKLTIISMALLALAASSLLHEGLGHGLTAYLRGDIPTLLTSNHLDDLRPDRLVDAGGTLVNLLAGSLAMFLSTRAHLPNLRYFLWLLASFNLMDGAGYFLFSGIIGVGDWEAVIGGLPHYLALRITMTIFGAALYFLVVKLMMRVLQPFCPDRTQHRGLYNTVGRLPYYAACAFYCLAGAFDPLGVKLLLLSTIPAAFGGNSGFMWADSLLPKHSDATPLTVARSPAWMIAALVIGIAYILTLGRGIPLHH